MGNTTNNNKKKSATRKLIPAVGMLMTSVAMLTTSTYAWFTMSKEVSITGITLTATVPETLEISLGSTTTKPSKNSSTNVITITAPGTGEQNVADWSNSIDIGAYYVGGDSNSLITEKLLPVSSVDGLAMYYTSDAIADGRSLSETSVITQASTEFSGNADKDRYYLDIPVWFRTSSKSETASNVDLTVTADITDPTGKNLYKAARVSILNDDGSASSSKVIKGVDAEYNKEGEAISSEKQSGQSLDEKYGAVSFMSENDVVVSVPKKTSDDVNYGEIKKAIVRVWLEGEDKSCYNPNAGQSFNVNLTFKQPTTT